MTIVENPVSTIATPEETGGTGFTFFVDVSSPGDVDFGALRAGGCEAVIFQTGDGLGEEFANDVPAQLAPQARDAGLRIGFYHYNRPRRLAQGNVADEARWMKELTDRAGGLRPGVDLRIVMDVEAPDAADVAVDVAEFTRQLGDQLRGLFGHEPLLYSGWDYARNRLASVGGDIWVAWYPEGGLSFDQAQARWTDNVRDQGQIAPLRPVAWQYGGDVNGGVAGVAKCDTSVAPGSLFADMVIPAGGATVAPEAVTAPAPAPDDAAGALARITEWNFRDGVRSFQEAFTAWDLAVDGDLGPKTAEAVTQLVGAGGKLSDHFHLDEFRCKHCGRARVNRELVRALERLRPEVGPLTAFSSYRCEEHPIEAAKAAPGQHAQGTAWDPDPYLPLSATSGKGFSGLGHTAADPSLASHLDVRHAGAANVTESSPDDPAEFEDN